MSERIYFFIKRINIWLENIFRFGIQRQRKMSLGARRINRAIYSYRIAINLRCYTFLCNKKK